MTRHPQRHRLRFIMLFSGILLAAFFVSPILAEDTATSEKLQQADELSVIAVKRAAEARQMCGCDVLKEALESVNEAAVLLSELAAEADGTGNLALAQEVYDMATNIVGQAIHLVTEVCMYCSQASVDIETVKCFEQSCARAAETDKLNNETIEAALAAGAIPPRSQVEAAKESPYARPGRM